MRAIRTFKTVALLAITFLLLQPAMAQSGDDKSTHLNVHPSAGPDRYYITVDHPAANDAQVKLVDTNGKVLQQVTVNKSSLQTKLSINGLVSGTYKIVWSNGAKTIEQSLLMM